MESDERAEAIAKAYPWRAPILRALVIAPVAAVVWAALVFVPAALYDRVWGWEHDSAMSLRASAGVAVALTILWAGAAWTRLLSPLRSGIVVGVSILLGVLGWAGLSLRMFEWKPCSPEQRSVRVRQCAYFHIGSEEHIGFDRASGPPLGSWCPAFVRDLGTTEAPSVPAYMPPSTRVSCAEVGMESMTVCRQRTYYGHVHAVGANASCTRVIVYDGTDAPPPSEWRVWDACRRQGDDACQSRWPQRRSHRFEGLERPLEASAPARDAGADR